MKNHDKMGRFTKGNQSGYLSSRYHKRLEDIYPVKQIAVAYQGGESCESLAKIHKCHPWIINTIVTRQGIRIRTRQEAGNLAVTSGRLTLPHSRGADHGNWKGGRRGGDDYMRIYMPNHPRARQNYVTEQILVWEKTHGVSLPDEYIVHHLNNVKTDNRPENLLALSVLSHQRVHSTQLPRLRGRWLPRIWGCLFGLS